jgi:preprotein translocase subunit SecD
LHKGNGNLLLSKAAGMVGTMKVTVDTNVLVRAVVRDDIAQADKYASRLMASFPVIDQLSPCSPFVQSIINRYL